MAKWFGRRKPRGEAPKGSYTQQLADALGTRVAAPTNAIHPSPTQHKVLESMITRPSGLVAVLESVSQCSQLIPPGVVDNPTTLEVPVSGHNLVLSLVNGSAGTVTVTNLRAVYTSCLAYDFPAQLMATKPTGPDLVYADHDQRLAAEESANGTRPLEKPHYEIHLSGDVRPLIVEALLPDGERPRERIPIPLSLGPDETARIVLAPVTHLPACIGWRLVIRWHEDGADLYAGWDLLVTGNTCWTETGAGAEPRRQPVGKLGHWDPHSYYQDGHNTYQEHLKMTAQPNPSWQEAVRRARD